MFVKRTLSSLSVLALCAASPAFAQDIQPSEPTLENAPSAETMPAPSGSPLPSQESDTSSELQQKQPDMQNNVEAPTVTAPDAPDATRMSESDNADSMSTKSTHRVSQLLGSSIVSVKDESIGEIEDIVLDGSGEADTVLVGVGGFLGIGEKTVAVSYKELEFIEDSDGDLMIKAPMTREQLENAPAYKVAAK